MPHFAIDPELKGLILAQLDGSISEPQYRRLQELLNGDGECRRYYAEYIMLCAALKRHGKSLAAVESRQEDADICDRQLWTLLAENERTAPGIAVEREVAVEAAVGPRPVEKKKISRLSLCIAAGSLAAMIGMFIFVLLNTRPEPFPVGYLARTIDAAWSAEQGPVIEGDLVRTGPLVLEKGLAEVVLDGGARMVLEGPVRLELESSSQVYMDRGKLSVLAQAPRDGFVVRTPGCRVVDFGTEFGVSVNAAGQTETHVRQGRVQLRNASQPSRDSEFLELTARQAARSRPDGRLEKVAYEETEFIYKNEFAIRVKGREESGYYRWLAHSYALRRDPDLVLYYPLLKEDTSREEAVNYATTTQAAADGAFGGSFGISNFAGPAWTAGRWPQKAALQFDRDKRTCLAVGEAADLNRMETLTLAAWVRCPEDSKGGHLFSNRRDDLVNYQFGCFSQEDPYYAGQMQFLRAGEPAASQVYSSRRFEWTSEWTLLAVTYDGRTVRFYVNGELFESTAYAAQVPVAAAPLFVGDVPAIGGRTFGYAAFHGLMDEIAIWKRALPADEIAKMYEAGKP